jgi:Protein of unknown function (DUF3352)
MARRFHLFPVLGLLAALAAGCGGASSTGAGAADGASVAPASAPVFVSIDTDVGSAQWQQAGALLGKFPARQTLLDAINKEFAKRGVSYQQDVKPALGSEVDVAVLGLEQGSRDVVAMVQPGDKAKLQALLAKLDTSHPSSPATATAEYKGWTLISDKQSSIDRFKSEAAQGSLADDATFKDAMAGEPSGSLVRAYVNGSALQQLLERLGSRFGAATGCGSASQPAGTSKLRYISGALSTEANGLRLHAAVQSDNAPSGGGGDTKALLSEIPSGSLVVLAFHGADQFTQGFQQLQQSCGAQLQKSLAPLEALLGVKLVDLAGLFKNETALYVRTGSPLPEVTLISHQGDPQAALATLDTLARRLGALAGTQPKDTTVDGLPAKEMLVGGRVTIYYAAFGGKVVVTDSTAGISDLRGGGAKLADDPTFRDATKAAGMPDSTGGFLYVNLKDGIPYAESFAQLVGMSIPAQVDANLRPLQAFVVYGSTANGKAELTAFLELQ